MYSVFIIHLNFIIFPYILPIFNRYLLRPLNTKKLPHKSIAASSFISRSLIASASTAVGKGGQNTILRQGTKWHELLVEGLENEVASRNDVDELLRVVMGRT